MVSEAPLVIAGGVRAECEGTSKRRSRGALVRMETISEDLYGGCFYFKADVVGCLIAN